MSRNSILEGLYEQRNIDSIFEGLGNPEGYVPDIDEEYFYYMEEDFVNEQVEIDEAGMVTFGNQTFPQFGQALIMIGAPGSGKGYIRKNKVLADFKTLDVDRLKELYIAAKNRGKDIAKGDTHDYDLKNPDDVSLLHQKVKDLGVKDAQEKSFFADLNKDRLPNVCYDITGDDPEKNKKIAKALKDLGYKVSAVWVITNRQVAMIQNLTRDRVVSQQIFHKIHNDIYKNVLPFLKSGSKDIDEAWLVINSRDNAKALTDKERKQISDIGTIKLEKKGSGFEIPRETEMMIYNILGPTEEDPLHPQTYKDMKEVDAVEIEKVKAGVDTLIKKTDKVKKPDKL